MSSSSVMSTPFGNSWSPNIFWIFSSSRGFFCSTVFGLNLGMSVLFGVRSSNYVIPEGCFLYWYFKSFYLLLAYWVGFYFSERIWFNVFDWDFHFFSFPKGFNFIFLWLKPFQLHQKYLVDLFLLLLMFWTSDEAYYLTIFFDFFIWHN